MKSDLFTRDVYLSVLDSPVIFSNPQNEVRNERQNVTLWCELEAKPLATITWTKNGENIINDSRIIYINPETVQRSNASMTITNVTRQDEGTYVCNVSNTVGPVVQSGSGFLTVNCKYIILLAERSSCGINRFLFYPDPPFVFTNPGYESKVEGQLVTIWCEFEAKPLATITWKKNNKNITSDNRINITNPTAYGHGNSTLTITNVNRTDEGSYTCTVVNVVNTVTSSSSYLNVDCKYLLHVGYSL